MREFHKLYIKIIHYKYFKQGHLIWLLKKSCTKKDYSQLPIVNPEGVLSLNKAAPCGRQNSGQISGNPEFR